jgi:hypothetical protein
VWLADYKAKAKYQNKQIIILRLTISPKGRARQETRCKPGEPNEDESETRPRQGFRITCQTQFRGTSTHLAAPKQQEVHLAAPRMPLLLEQLPAPKPSCKC